MRSILIASCALAGSLLLGACGPDDGEDGQTSTPPAANPAPAPTPTPSPAPSPATPTAWQPAVDDTWQWQLLGTINTSYPVKVYDIDLVETPQSTIDTLHAQGKRVICYFSAGSSEDFRPDFNRFKPADQGRDLDGWEGERWLDIRSDNVRAIMKNRLDLAVSKKCDGVEPDNVDGYANDTGFPLSGQNQINYNLFLANEAHSRGLKVGLKNDLDQVKDLAPSFDFAVNEQCHEYKECATLAAFTQTGKPVFNAEYKDVYVDNASTRAELCRSAKSEKLRTLVLPLDLDDSFRYSCE